MNYLRSFADHFVLLEHIRFTSKVLSIMYEGYSDEDIEAWTLWGGTGKAFGGGSKWRLKVQDTQSNLPLNEFDSVYGRAWQCVVGTSYGSYVTHSEGGFVYFSMDESLSVLLFKTEVKEVD